MKMERNGFLINRIEQITGPNIERAPNSVLVIKRANGKITVWKNSESSFQVTAIVGGEQTGTISGNCFITVHHIDDAREAAQFAWTIATKEFNRKKRRHHSCAPG